MDPEIQLLKVMMIDEPATRPGHRPYSGGEREGHRVESAPYFLEILDKTRQ